MGVTELVPEEALGELAVRWRALDEQAARSEDNWTLARVAKFLED